MDKATQDKRTKRLAECREIVKSMAAASDKLDELFRSIDPPADMLAPPSVLGLAGYQLGGYIADMSARVDYAIDGPGV